MKSLMFALVFTVLVGARANAAQHSSTVKDWTFKDFGDGTSAAQTFNDSGSTLGVYCAAEKQCVLFLRAETNCTPDGKYPVLVNADSGAMAQNTTCVNLGSPDSKDQFALVFDDFQGMLNTILKDRTVGFSIPMASGMFKVTRFSLEGSNEVLSAVGQTIKGTAKPAGLKDQVL